MITKLIIIFGQWLKCQLHNLFRVVTGPLPIPLIPNFCALKYSNNMTTKESAVSGPCSICKINSLTLTTQLI